MHFTILSVRFISVNTITMLRAVLSANRGYIPSRGRDTSSPHCIQAVVSVQLSIEWVLGSIIILVVIITWVQLLKCLRQHTGVYFFAVQRPGLETNHLPISLTKVRNMWNCTLLYRTPSLCGTSLVCRLYIKVITPNSHAHFPLYNSFQSIQRPRHCVTMHNSLIRQWILHTSVTILLH
jgi:hypothetical protein